MRLLPNTTDTMGPSPAIAFHWGVSGGLDLWLPYRRWIVEQRRATEKGVSA